MTSLYNGEYMIHCHDRLEEEKEQNHSETQYEGFVHLDKHVTLVRTR